MQLHKSMLNLQKVTQILISSFRNPIYIWSIILEELEFWFCVQYFFKETVVKYYYCEKFQQKTNVKKSLIKSVYT